MRIIPAIDLMGGRVVRLYRGDPARSTTYGDDPAATARRWEADGADMIHVVDLDAALGTGSNAGRISEILGAVSVPVQVAGGLRTPGAIEGAARSCARVVVGTAAFEDRAMLDAVAGRIGRERVVISVDHVDGEVVVRGWKKGTGEPLIRSVSEFLGAGYTEFLLTSVPRDGTMGGPELSYLAEACALGGANVIASGGISSHGDVRDVGRAGAAGVILGRALYEGAVTVRGSAAWR
ncbi:1-(5-phosphoribosyl)-5-((5-phosphoribosylamino)methylideneamino) imidazole-4-carboxamide isomerase [Nitrosopumilaceae archaeon]|nr:1-(5-phosphoribosyl)-5-[(5-phosphoribosylamino)methylideneamino] imidazole-4-carboxamide isomerase [Nitrosopumilus sp.]CAI9832007.1 1-(5-phosphoribosyl)-5-((5-phosphoribosylamino)methylideneamino) imidazole-4-carboxamide isomerase [Nitrosopumilaceae archaeon]MDA7943494.1 1-(5-phosphoribosyl)-5-[(5-phosphoribosylamino)methylideneamino] imidazole-4-carboxamide isomerase [Nitrosopumilus sp.]MDA7954703.1 1-(5-phosphoribosyl)-5-[(5-phosphoribosylamino)methylideneamino] imidazole-4-carboxamide isom